MTFPPPKKKQTKKQNKCFWSFFESETGVCLKTLLLSIFRHTKSFIRAKVSGTNKSNIAEIKCHDCDSCLEPFPSIVARGESVMIGLGSNKNNVPCKKTFFYFNKNSHHTNIIREGLRMFFFWIIPKSKFNIYTTDLRVILSIIFATGVHSLLLKFLQKNSPHNVQTKGGGMKGFLNNVQKNCTFLSWWLP